MMELVSDFSIRCEHCNNILYMSKDDFDPEVSSYDHGENAMGVELDYLIEYQYECPYCKNSISFEIFGSEYPYGAYDSDSSKIIGGGFIEEPHFGILYEIDEFETSSEYVEATGIQQLIMQISVNKNKMFSITPREFEELVEQIFKDNGFNTELTQQTHDGGKDIIATHFIMGKPVVFYIECKQYRQDRPIGINLIHSLAGIQSIDRVNKAVLVTTTYFTRGAQLEASKQNTLIDLIDGNKLHEFIQESANKYREDNLY